MMEHEGGQMMARQIGICASRINTDLWVLECSECGPLGLITTGQEDSDRACVAHLKSHNVTSITAHQ